MHAAAAQNLNVVPTAPSRNWPGIYLAKREVASNPVRIIALLEKLLLMRSRLYSPKAVQKVFEAAGGRVRLERKGGKFWAMVEAGTASSEE